MLLESASLASTVEFSKVCGKGMLTTLVLPLFTWGGALGEVDDDVMCCI